MILRALFYEYMITVNTKLVALLGMPLGHSLSPAMHNRAYREMGLNYCYLPIEVSAENLATVFAAMKKMNFAGCNITSPHKVAIIRLLDELDPLAATIGAVNTVQFKNGKAKGFNTDGAGFLRSLKEEAGVIPSGKRFLIFGSGGAARAIAFTLATEKAAQITLCNRTKEKAIALAAEINKEIRPCADTLEMKQATQCKYTIEADVLINATNIGMLPHNSVMPCPKTSICTHHTVIDIVYHPYKTAFLQAAEKKGAKIVHGLSMLIWQGAAAFTLFTGKKPVVSTMQKEIKQILL